MTNLIKDQKHTDQYSIYNGDCYDVIKSIPDESIDFSVYSPPFCGLYQYSSDNRDMSNCNDKEEFLQQYEFLIKEKSRVTKKGRLTAVHCQDILTNVTTNVLYDFPADIIKLHEKHGFSYVNKICVSKEPFEVRMRTMVRSLMHKLVVDDMTSCFTAMPDFVLIFRKKGENKIPVENLRGLEHYFGATPITKPMRQAFNNANDTNLSDDGVFELLKENHLGKSDELYNEYINCNDEEKKESLKNQLKDVQKKNQLSQYIWRRYADAFWDDVRVKNVLPFKKSREDDDEKHVHPLQLDVIQRLIYMYTNEGENVLTPFMGVGSEVYGAVSLNRKGVGVELKDSYYKQATLNLDNVKPVEREVTNQQQKLFE